MITRIVRLTFIPQKIPEFLKIFDSSKEKIRQSPGCCYLSLHQDDSAQNVFYTISQWETHADLDQYRQSDFFKSTWSKTKVLFSDKPRAFSLNKLDELQ